MVACSWCGTSAPDVPLDWVVESDSRHPEQPRRHYCPTCAREHLRAMEAKLDFEYW